MDAKEILQDFKEGAYQNSKSPQTDLHFTDAGEEKTGKYQIDDIEIKKPERWDKKWRILIFDIKNEEKNQAGSASGENKRTWLVSVAEKCLGLSL